MNNVAGAEVVAGMAACHAQRAAEYERVCFKPERQAELRRMETELAAPSAGRCVLEIARGPGWWTRHGAPDAASRLATDVKLETMAIAQTKALPACVRFATVDAFTLEGAPGDAMFNACFAGWWWRHVPMQRLPSWLGALPAGLARGARVVFIDNSRVQTSSTPCSDGSTHEAEELFHRRSRLCDVGPACTPRAVANAVAGAGAGAVAGAVAIAVAIAYARLAAEL